MKYIQVERCSEAHKWYKDHIGASFPLLAIEKEEYKTRQPEGYINFISKNDATIVEITAEA